MSPFKDNPERWWFIPIIWWSCPRSDETHIVTWFCSQRGERLRERKKKNRKATALSRLECVLSLLPPLILDHFWNHVNLEGSKESCMWGASSLAPYHRCLFISLFFSQGAKIPSNKTSAIERCWLCCDFHQQQQNPPISAHKERWRNPSSYFSTKGLGAFLPLLAARLGWLVKVWGSNCGIHEPNSWNHMFPFIPRIPNQILLLMLSAPNTEILGSIS